MENASILLCTELAQMFDAGDVIDDKYIVDSVCSNAGGMGTVLFVTPKMNTNFRVVLKYCKNTNEEELKRFRREVRLLASFEGNSKVVRIVDCNLDYDPPYFVMKYYEQGDLFKHAPTMANSLEAQEQVILQMIDCIQELHSRNEFHRDIKPQNFLVDNNYQVVVSDFGLTTEIGSETGFTRSSVYWGTHGYIPPEFLTGGFKHPDATSDVFMLGKTIYALLTQRDPLYLVSDGIHAPIFHIIERCCSIPKAQRYQTLSELRQSVVAAFDVLLGRSGGIGKAKQLLSAIEDRLEQDNKYSTDEVSQFIEQLALIDEADQIKICFEASQRFFTVIRQEPVVGSLTGFLAAYEKLVESQNYSWSYAEIIAKNMQTIFSGTDVSLSQKTLALDLAIRAACYMNRFAAMDTCRGMITSINDENLGLNVVGLVTKHNDTFVGLIEPSECNCDSIANALRAIRES